MKSKVSAPATSGERSIRSLKLAAAKAGVTKAIARASTLGLVTTAATEMLLSSEQSSPTATVLGGLAVAGSMVFAGANRKRANHRGEIAAAQAQQAGEAIRDARLNALREQMTNEQSPSAPVKEPKRPGLVRRTFFAQPETQQPQPRTTTEQQLGATAVASPAAMARLEQLQVTDQTQRDVQDLHRLAVNSVQVPQQTPPQPHLGK